MKNIHAQSIPAEILGQANQKVDEVMALLTPYLLSLTADERKYMLKIGEKNLSFVEKAAELGHNNPSLCPSYLNMDEFDVDLADTLGLRGILNKLHQLTSGVDDTMMISGGEAYNAALVFYNASKGAMQQNIPGAKAVYEELRKRFPGRGKASGNNEEEKQEKKEE